MARSRGYSSGSNRRHRASSLNGAVLGRVFDYPMVVVSLIVAVLLIASYFAPYVDPSKWIIFSLLGLIAPLLYIFNVLLLLYWVLRWKKYVFIPLLAFVLGFGNVSLFYRPFISKQYTHEQNKRQFKLVTFNVCGFMEKRDGVYVSTMDSDALFIADLAPDILCMQEFQSTRRAPRSMFDDKLSGLMQSVHNYRLKSDYGGWGLAIYSRYPILRSGVVDFESSTNSAMWADVKLSREDTIRVFNCHLQTTTINSEDRSYIENQEFLQSNGDQIEKKMRNIVGKLKHNYLVRAQQADTLALLIRESPYRVIVCGDFNDTPLSYSYKTIRGDLSDAFIEKGRGLSTTYSGLFNMFRIDYVLHSPDLKTVSYETPYLSPSDHTPVCVGFVPEPKKHDGK